MNARSRALFVIFFVSLLGAIVIAAAEVKTSRETTAAVRLADLSSCLSRTADIYAPSGGCLRASVEKLLSDFTPEEILSYANASTTPLAVTSNCHDIGHVVGEMSLARTGSLEQTLSECPTTCNNACTHGAIGAEVLRELGKSAANEEIQHADVATIEKTGSTYCAKSQPLCHGIGHVLYMARPEYAESLPICQKITSGSRQESCFEGVFMESFGSELSLHFATSSVQNIPENLSSPCTELAPEYQEACFKYLPALERSRFPGYSDARIRELSINLCKKFSGTERAYCFTGIGGDGGSTQAGVARFEEVKKTCAALTPEDRSACILGIVRMYRLYEKFDELAAYCGSAPDPALTKACESN